jgi:hypothetical protein
VPYANQTDTQCGTGGVTCGACATGRTCSKSASACVSWCGRQAIPSGVAASDYQCVDFEEAAFPPPQWTRAVIAPGSLAVTNTRASSVPNSLNSTCPLTPAGTGRATIDWAPPASGANVTSVSVAAALNPVTPSFDLGWPDYMDLLCVAFTNEYSYACLTYTYANSGTLFQTTPYTGLFLRFQYTIIDAIYTEECPVTASFTSNVWTNAELRVNAGTGVVEAIVNGTTSSCGSRMPPVPSTAPMIWVGSKAHWSRSTTDGDDDWTTFFDNVVVAVRR